MRRPVGARCRGLVALLVVPLALSGCGGQDEDEEAGGSAHGGPSAASEAPPSWNPCDDLTPREVSRLLGEDVTEEVGSATALRCTYVPVAEGGPTLDLNYLWFDGSFEEAWDSMGRVAGTVVDLDIPGADDARMVVQTTDDAVLVTGFVQTRGLIESVNAVALSPDDRKRLVRASRAVLTLLSERAPTQAE